MQFRPAGYYEAELERLSQTTKHAILGYAELVMQGKFCCLGYEPAFLGLPPHWSVDFVSGKNWPPLRAEELTVVRHDGSDVKVPWELSRLQFLPVLGKAWRISSDTGIRECSKNLLSNWIQENPVGFGVNWTIAMEAALRAISICFLLELLWPFSSAEQPWLEAATRSLWEHFLFIEAHNEFSHLTRSNHYLSNITGLHCLSAYLQGSGMSARSHRYSNLLQREMQHQVNEDGGDYEASVGYHVLVTQMFTTSLQLMKRQGIVPSTEFVARLRKMYEFMQALADEHGRLPHVGDCDDGRVELLADDIEQVVGPNSAQRDSLAVSGLLGIGTTVLDCDFSGVGDHAARHDSRSRSVSFVPPKEIPAHQVFPVSGVARAHRGECGLFFFAIPNGIGGKGSHTHNDKLSVILRIGGYEFLTDSGTFCYTRDATKRNHFRATLAHNTVRIDGQEQNRFSEKPVDLFRMQNDAAPSRIQVNDNGTSTQFCAEHRGYERLGVIHRRQVTLNDAAEAIIDDDITGWGKHSIEAAWHLPGPWQPKLEHASGHEVLCSVQEPVPVQMKFSSSVLLQVVRARAPISTSYGAAEDGTMLTVSATAELPFQLSTKISWAHA